MEAGGLAQLARAPALQAGGQRFESVILHRRSLTCWKKEEQEHEAKTISTQNDGTSAMESSRKKVRKGAWGMPRLSEAKKDVISCEKLRRGANSL